MSLNLTPRQTEVLHQAIQGLTNKEIALELNMATETVRTHVRAITQVTGKRRAAWWQVVESLPKKVSPFEGLLK